MSYTSIIVNSGTTSVGNPIGVNIPYISGDIKKDESYVLQFKVRLLDNVDTLNNIQVGNQTLPSINLSQFKQVTLENVSFYDCFIVFIASNDMIAPKVSIGRIKTSSDANNLDIFEITEIGLSKGNTNKEYKPNPNDLQIVRQELTTMIEQLADMIALKAERKEVDSVNNKVSTALGELQVKAGEITLKASNEEMTSLGNRVSVAEQKITADSIVSTVTKSTAWEQTSSRIEQLSNAINLKVSSNNIISSINMTPEAIKINTNLLDLTGNLDIQGTFTSYKSQSNKQSNYLKTSGAMMFGYNEVGGNYPVFASGLWTDQNMGYFSVGYTRADVSDANGCLWISPQHDNVGCRLTYSKLLSDNSVVTTNLFFQKDGSIDFNTTMRGLNDTDDAYTYRFDSGVSTKALRCNNLRTHNIYPRTTGSHNIGSASMRFKDIFADSLSTTNAELNLGTVNTDGTWKSAGAICINSTTGQLFPLRGGFDLGNVSHRFKDIYADSLGTTNTEIKLGTVDTDSTWKTYGPLLVNSGSGYVYPLYNGNFSLGTSSLRFHGIYLVNSPNVSSDIRVKTDIHYLGEQEKNQIINGRSTINMNITTKDMYDFIKDDLKLASYRYNNNLDRNITSVDYGFIAQDILYTKVGSEIVQLTDKEDLDSELAYNQSNYISTIAGALQEEIKIRDKQIDDLQNQINELKEILNEKGE